MEKQQYEDPINTAKDLIEKNVTIFEISTSFHTMKQAYLEQNTSEWKHIANNMIAVNSSVLTNDPEVFCILGGR